MPSLNLYLALNAIFLSLLVFFGFLATTSDPTDPLIYFQLKFRNHHQLELSLSKYSKFCSDCKLKIQMFTRHCKQCNRCCSDFDHHCKWINNCVGKTNYHLFVKSCLFLVIYEAFYLLWAGMLISKLNSSLELCSSLAILSLLNFFVFVLPLYLLIFHTFLKFKSYSTISYRTHRKMVDQNKLEL